MPRWRNGKRAELKPLFLTVCGFKSHSWYDKIIIIMEKNEVKKALYKQNPKAELKFIRKGVAYHLTVIEFETEPVQINFEVPVNDMGDADFEPFIDAKLLIRWIVD